MTGAEVVVALAIAAFLAVSPLAIYLTVVCVVKWVVYLIRLHICGVAYNQKKEYDRS